MDGAATALACAQLAPSLRVFRLPGLFESRREARQVMARLRNTVADELSANGFALLGIEPFGADVFFSNEPIRSFEDLARQRMWVWDRDEVWRAVAALFGLHATPLPLDQVSRALDEHRLDGLIALPERRAGVPVVDAGSLFHAAPVCLPASVSDRVESRVRRAQRRRSARNAGGRRKGGCPLRPGVR